MHDVGEMIILEVDNVRITTVRAFIGWKTYEISSIVSAILQERNLSPAAGKAGITISFISLVLGILSCIAAFSGRFISIIENLWGWPRINVHFLFAVLGLLFIYRWLIGREVDKTTYIVQIETASGKSNILESKDKDHIQRVIDAINNAIARRV